MGETATALRLSLTDVSLLARVQRPVVSMWRTRNRNTETPFPNAVEISNNQELFDADEVVSWLQQTGRGKNPDAADDAAAFASNARDNFEVLSALLVVQSLSGHRLAGMDPEDVLDLAEEIDPDDEFLFGEIEEYVSSLEPLQTLSDQLSEASYSPVAAFEKLMEDRSRAQRTEALFAPEAIELMALTAVALSGDSRVFADATPGGSDLLLAIAGNINESETAALGLSPLTNYSSRLALRRLRLHTFNRENLRLEEFSERVPGLVTVAHFPGREQPGLSGRQILTAIDDISLDMDSGQAAVILAPARLLTDALPSGTTARIREALLRSGKIHAVVRLPVGLLKSKPRQPMALWVIGKERTEIPIADRWTMVADLSVVGLDDSGRNDLVADLLASMYDRNSLRARAFRFARFVQTRLLLAGDGNLCGAPRSPRLSRTTGPDAAALLVMAQSEIDSLNRGAANRLLDIRIEPGTAIVSPSATLEDLLRAKQVKLVPGARLQPADTLASEGFTVMGLPELRGGIEPRYIDRLLLASGYPNAQLTEPGDVIFSTVGESTAMVDQQGACVVQYPARILRISRPVTSGLIPSVLAADVAAGQGGPWRRWPVKRFPTDQHAETESALTSVSRERQAALDRITHLDRLSTLLVEGSTAGTLRITNSTTPLEGNS